jgi:hypothetical protein
MKRMSLVPALLVAMAAAGTLAAENSPDLSVLPSTFRGVMLYPDGKTPVEKVGVTVWNADTEEVVFKTKTDRDGVFEIPRLEEGNHYVTAGPVRIDMRLLRARGGVKPQAHGLVVVVPKRMPVAHFLVPGVAAAGLVPQIMSP